jgi:glycosyltransferase involved in cell wall biosynthesis
LYGAEQVLLTLMSGLLVRGHEPIFGSLRTPGEPARPIELEARRRGVQVWPIEFGRQFAGRAMRELAGRAATESVAVIHSHGYKANILNGACLARHRSFATMTTLHGWTGMNWRQRVWWYQCLEREILPRFDAIAVVRRGMLNGRLARPAVAGKTHLIQNGIPLVSDLVATSTPDEDRMRELREFCNQGPTIGFVGRLSAEKGVEILLRAFAPLRREYEGLQLAIVGDGPLRDRLTELSAQLGIAHCVRFAGFVPCAAAVLPCFKALAMPSLQEGLPIILLEAMRARVPIVASAVGGIPEALEDGMAGKLVAPRQAPLLAAAIKSLLDDPAAADTLKQHAYRRFHANYTEGSMVSSYVSVYEQLKQSKEHGDRS